jgi:hypothetical protein
MEKLKFITILTIILFSLVLSTPIKAWTEADEPVIIMQFGESGSGDGELLFPMALDLSKNGNIYVPDIGNDRINKYDSSGSFILSWGSKGTGNGQFRWPSGIAIYNNNVYISDFLNERIQKFDIQGNYILQWGGSGTGDGKFDINGGWEIDVDENGYVYAPDFKNHRIQKFDSNGNFVDKVGSYGTGPYQLVNPSAITIASNDNVYVLCTGQSGFWRGVKVYTANFTYVTEWQGDGSEPGEFSSPYGIASDSGNYIYVVDMGNDRIQKFDSEGNFIMLWDDFGSPEGENVVPTGITIDDNDRIYVLERMAPKIIVYQYDKLPPVVYLDNNQDILGIVGKVIDNLTEILQVEIRVSEDSEWFSCESTDGKFDELEEDFVCIIPDDFKGDKLSVYVRATDSRTNTNSTLNTGSEYDIAVVTILPETGVSLMIFLYIGLFLSGYSTIKILKLKKRIFKI